MSNIPLNIDSLGLEPGEGAQVQGSSRDVPLVFLYGGKNVNSTFITTLYNNILSVNVNYSLSAATAVTFEVIDPGLQMTLNNYFQIGQTIIYRSHNTDIDFNADAIAVGTDGYLGYFMEIADVTISQAQGNSPIVRVQCYTKAIQQMKRDRKPGVVKGSGSEFVVNAANKYGLQCVAQKTSQSVNITQASGEDVADSLWDVLTRLAGETKDSNKNPYIIFECDGVLYFGSQQWLMYKWGVDKYTHKRWNKKLEQYQNVERRVTYLHFPPRIKDDGSPDTRFILHQLPQMHKSENDPLEGDGSCIVDRRNGVRLRPGMTVNVGQIPWFTDDFLITSVDFAEMSPEPVGVSFATPPRQEKLIKNISVGEILPGSVEWATVIGLQTKQKDLFGNKTAGSSRTARTQ